MNGSAVAGLCRLRFRAPDALFELSVPSDVPLADLLPAVLRHAGADFEEQGVEHDGWVLQRLGGEPLDEELGTEALGLHDGDDLYLRPRREALPAVHFDDLADGVATGMRELPDTWRPALTHHLALALALTALAGGLALLLLPGPQQTRDLAAAVTGLLLLFGAASASRAVGDAGAGTAFGAAVLALAAAGCAAPLFLGAVLLGLFTMAGGILVLAGRTLVETAAVLAVLAVLLGAFVPGLCFRLSGLRLPALPRNAEELQEGIQAFASDTVLTRSAHADGFLSAFHLALGAVFAFSLGLLSGGPGWAAPTMTAVLSVLLLLHSRAIGSIRQRLALLLPAVLGLVLLAARFALGEGTAGRLLLLGALLALAGALAVLAWTVPGRRLLPYWGRAADLLHTLAALALLPLMLDVTGVYHALRAIAG